jgi:anaerobic magnesium-protoporphyrin IX monomethyl ester cyclase
MSGDRTGLRIAFVNPSLRPDAQRRQLPVGLAYIMTAAERAGFAFDLIDMDIDRLGMDGLRERLARGYDVVALGCIVTGFNIVRDVAQVAKDLRPTTVVIAGNSVATSIPEVLLTNTRVDVAVLGEGDITIVEVLRAIEDGIPLTHVAGIAYRQDGEVRTTAERPIVAEVDELGFPDWALFDLAKYEQYGRVNANIFSEHVLSYPLNAARGCPYSCTFCYHVFRGQRYRKYSEAAVIDEIRRLHDVYRCDFIAFWDELTFPTVKSVRRMIDALKGLEFPIAWEATIRGDLFTAEHVPLIREMREVGCENMSYSLENASPDILAAMNKKLDVGQFVRQSEALWEGGVTPLTSVVFGYPQETAETIRQTIDVCRRCRIFPSVGFLLPLPGTPIYEWTREDGRITDEVEYLTRIADRQDLHINLTLMSDEELYGTVESELRRLAAELGLELESVFKTVTYQRPKDSEG